MTSGAVEPGSEMPEKSAFFSSKARGMPIAASVLLTSSGVVKSNFGSRSATGREDLSGCSAASRSGVSDFTSASRPLLALGRTTIIEAA